MASTSHASRKRVEDAEISQYFHLRKMKIIMNPTVTKMDSWMTILKQMKMKALVLVAQKLLI
jgi:hypothetical protein